MREISKVICNARTEKSELKVLRLHPLSYFLFLFLFSTFLCFFSLFVIYYFYFFYLLEQWHRHDRRGILWWLLPLLNFVLSVIICANFWLKIKYFLLKFFIFKNLDQIKILNIRNRLCWKLAIVTVFRPTFNTKI